MKIEITAEQAKMILHALKLERITICNSTAPTARKAAAKTELNALRNMIALTMMKSGFITQDNFSKGIY